MDATEENFTEIAGEGNVLLDIWGPQCAPCIALMPAIDALGAEHADRVRLVKVNAPENRQVCRDLRVAGLPTYITMRGGEEVERLTGADTSIDDIEAAVQRLLNGAPVTGLPLPEHLR